MPELALSCMESWKKYCPDYEIVRWDETNFDIRYCDYLREAFDAHKWAFVTDVVRLYALVNYGGIYMDTDVEVLKSLDDLLHYEAFSGFELKSSIPTGIMASEKGQVLFDELLHEYDNIHFLQADGSFDLTTNVYRITNTCKKYGLKPDNSLQTVRGFTLFPMEYFCPFDHATRKINLTENTYTIHHFAGSWQPEDRKYARALKVKLDRYLPPNISNHLGTFIAEAKYHGIRQAINRTIQWNNDKKGGK